MSNERSNTGEHPDVDPGHTIMGNPFDEPTGYSGQAYSVEREREMGRQQPSGHPLIGDPTKIERPAADPDGRDIPPENGRRAWIDPKTGEVHGSGSGAGGGGGGEDYDEATAGGS